ncbi:hypothetical protein ATCV1_z550R [Acanthocystis turfacea chlorella virus 1]|uniref:Uncharacterized protein z550R n=1 Tax=Chlorovirus heliozoae TaxID=322019 RepID=A7K9G0_9PHYC|nr:hypothetical protein ATCV1_z550R [Acanthocystis turfacea chlorella virus 1]ABT16684.1 hypothetical protein ATCV1_z550R [Acanthocystis turfacea chlorella virus 1]
MILVFIHTFCQYVINDIYILIASMSLTHIASVAVFSRMTSSFSSAAASACSFSARSFVKDEIFMPSR